MSTPQDPYGQDPYGRAPQGQPPPFDPRQQGYPQQGYPQQGYPQQGAAQPPAAPAGPPPRQVETSFVLWAVVVVLQLVGIALTFAERETLRAAAEEQARAQGGGRLDPQAVDAIVTFGIVFGIVLAVLFAGAILVSAIFMRRGQNWARIVLAVVGGLLVLFALVSLAGGTAGAVVQSLLTLVVVIAALVLMFTGPANAWFAARRGSR